MDEKQLRAWVTARIESNAPPAELQAGAIGQPIQELAATLSTLQGKGAMLFGMNVDRGTLAALADLAPVTRGLLERWRAALVASHGAEGATAVDTMVARHGITLVQTPDLATTSSAVPSLAVLDLLDRTLANTQALTRAWADQGLLLEDGDVVRVETGIPDRQRILEVAQRFTRATGLTLPALYVELLCRHDGISVWSGQADGPAYRTVQPTELEEPVLWPLGNYGDHHLLADVDLLALTRAFVLGELPDLGTLALDVGEGPSQGAVFYVPLKLSSEPPVRLADTMDAFLTAWCQCQLSLTLVLRAAGVPGFGP